MATDAELLAALDSAIADGKPGERGPQGNQGRDGVSIQNIEQTGEDSFDVNLTDGRKTTLSIPRGKDGVDGVPGAQGEQGPAGPIGKRGPAGAPGNDGSPGRNGLDGAGIDTAIVNSSGRLIVGMTDGQVIDVGAIMGPRGATGERGPTGLRGDDGADGSSIRSGFRPPNGEDGSDGDFWIDLSSPSLNLYGPKGSGNWSQTAVMLRLSNPEADERHRQKPTPNSSGAGSFDPHGSTSAVESVFGRTGNVVAQSDDYQFDQIGNVVLDDPQQGEFLQYNGSEWINTLQNPPAVVILGTTNVTLPVPTEYNGQPYVPSAGDMWVNTVAGVADASWVGLDQSNIIVNQTVVYGPDNQWHEGGVIAVLAEYMPLAGGNVSPNSAHQGARTDGSIRFKDNSGNTTLNLFNGGKIETYSNQMDFRSTNSTQALRAYGNTTKSFDFQVSLDGTTFNTYFQVKKLQDGQTGSGVFTYSIPNVAKATGLGDSGFVTQASSGAITGGIDAATGDIFTAGQIDMKHNNDASPAIINAYGGTGSNLSFMVGNAVNPIGSSEIMNIDVSSITMKQDVYLNKTNLWFNSVGTYQYIKVPTPVGSFPSKTLVMSTQEEQGGAIVNTQYWNAVKTEFKNAPVEVNGVPLNLTNGATLDLGGADLDVGNLTATGNVIAGGGATGYLGFPVGQSPNYLNTGGTGSYVTFSDNPSDAARSFAMFGWNETNFFRPIKVSRAMTASQTGSQGFQIEGIRPGYANPDNSILYAFYKTYAPASPASNEGDSIRYEGAILTSKDLVNKGYVDGLTSGSNTYTIDQVSGMTIATRDGEMNVNNSDPALVTFISFAPRGDHGSPIHPISGTDLIGILIGENVHIYQVKSGNYNALTVVHIRGTATFVPGETAEPRIFPSNYLQKKGAVAQVVEGGISLKSKPDSPADVGLKDIDGNNNWFVWHPDTADVTKPNKYVARQGSSHQFQTYDANNENVQEKAHFQHDSINLHNQSGENTIAYSITDAHYFKGAFQISNYAGTYENLKVDVDGKIWGREGVVPTVDRQLANKRYVDVKPSGRPYTWVDQSTSGNQLQDGQFTVNTAGNLIFAKKDAAGADIGLSTEHEVTGVKLQYSVSRYANDAWNVVVMGMTENYFIGSGTNNYNRIIRLTDILNTTGNFSIGELAYITFPGWL